MKSEKITGIRSVDFKIISKGHGVVNWNGPTTLKVQDDSKLGKNNHTLPKLRGYTNFSGKVTEKGFKEYKEPTDIDFKETPLYISQNCVRHHLFREQNFDVHYATKHSKEMPKLLASLVGLVRGYVVAVKIPLKRTSCLLLEDFVDQLGNGNFEQFGQSGTKEKSLNTKGEEKSASFYSKTTFGETEYLSYGSISVEQLQFISLDNKFDRLAMTVKTREGEKVASLIEEYIQSLDDTRSPKAVYHENYVRNGTIFEEGEMGILLNNDATTIVIEEVLRKLQELTIRQSKSYMYVDEVIVDYNDSSKMMRIKDETSEVKSTPNSEYAQYFYAKEK